MEAVTTGLLDFFARPMQMVITNPERHYHWQQADCQKLWQDIIQSGQDEEDKPHFLTTVRCQVRLIETGNLVPIHDQMSASRLVKTANKI